MSVESDTEETADEPHACTFCARWPDSSACPMCHGKAPVEPEFDWPENL